MALYHAMLGAAISLTLIACISHAPDSGSPLPVRRDDTEALSAYRQDWTSADRVVIDICRSAFKRGCFGGINPFPVTDLAVHIWSSPNHGGWNHRGPLRKSDGWDAATPKDLADFQEQVRSILRDLDQLGLFVKRPRDARIKRLAPRYSLRLMVAGEPGPVVYRFEIVEPKFSPYDRLDESLEGRLSMLLRDGMARR